VDLPDEAQALLALPPARFTAERDAVAARLAATGDPAASAVRKLRRPVGLAWVLNRLALELPRELEALLAAGDEVRAGTRRAVSGAGAGALRAAEQALRERARQLRMDAERILAGEGRPPQTAALSRVELLLRVAATGAARELLRAGGLLREPEVGGEDLSGFTVVAGGSATARRKVEAATPSPRPSPPARAGGEGGVRAAPAKAAREVRADRARERDARAREERELRERRRVLATARAEAARADRRATQEARRAEEAERRAGEARTRAAAAKAEADRLQAKVLELRRGR
jgi:hypothetical protein